MRKIITLTMLFALVCTAGALAAPKKAGQVVDACPFDTTDAVSSRITPSDDGVSADPVLKADPKDKKSTGSADITV